MFEGVRKSVIKSDVAVARMANHNLVKILKFGWRGGGFEDEQRAARNAAMRRARKAKYPNGRPARV